MLNKKVLKRFFKSYFFRLNNGMSYRASLYMADQSYAAQRFVSVEKERRFINLLLFIVTFSTTTMAGATSDNSIPDALLSGLPYSVTLMLILTVHEFGHYFASKRFGVAATLPYFIPFPSIVGTLGAVIKTKSPIPDRRALFYIGIMGPIPGFVVSLAAVTAGVMMSQVLPLPPADGTMPIFGDSILFASIVHIFHGTIPAGYDIALHPLAWAGWIGFFITSLNLMPIGQLDGGHVLYALIGRKQVYAGWLSLAVLVFLSFVWPGWCVWIIAAFFILMVAHPYIPATSELSLKEKAAGWFCMLILLLTFIPLPVQIR